MAGARGVADAVVDAIGHGEERKFTADDERVVYAIATQSAREGQGSQEAYHAGHGCTRSVRLGFRRRHRVAIRPTVHRSLPWPITRTHRKSHLSDVRDGGL
jgi:hypothetical protein